MDIQSVFASYATIPEKYTCRGENLSPPLQFAGIPRNAKSLVLIVDDPDAPQGVFDHWIIWNLPPDITKLSEGAPELAQLKFKPSFGVNHYGKTSYNGPCPPAGKPHHYHFKLYALSEKLSLAEGSKKAEVEAAMRPFIIDQTELVGVFERL